MYLFIYPFHLEFQFSNFNLFNFVYSEVKKTFVSFFIEFIFTLKVYRFRCLFRYVNKELTGLSIILLNAFVPATFGH